MLQEDPIHSVICFGQIQFVRAVAVLHFLFMLHKMKALKGQEGVVCYHPSWDKGALLRGDYVIENGTQPIHQTFSHNFIDDIAETNWPELAKGRGVLYLRY